MGQSPSNAMVLTFHFPNHENKSLALLYEEIDEEVGKYRSSPS